MSEPTKPQGFTFTGQVYPGETSVIERDGFTLTATIYRDDDQDPPWEREDGHGPVTDWLRREPEPGEVELCRDRGARRFYGYAEALTIAKRDGWGSPGDEALPAAHKIERAVQADMEFLRGWANDEWTYVGVAVTVQRAGVELTGQYDHALWGTDSLSGEHIASNADDFIDEALVAARAKLGELDDNPPTLDGKAIQIVRALLCLYVEDDGDAQAVAEAAGCDAEAVRDLMRLLNVTSATDAAEE